MRTSIICNDIDYFARHRRRVADELAHTGHDVLVLAGGNPLDVPKSRQWSYEHVRIERFSLRPMRDLGLAWRTFREIRQRKPDAIQLITLKPAVFAGLAIMANKLANRRSPRLVVLLPGLGRLMAADSELKGISSATSRKLVALVLRLLARQPATSLVFETSSDQARWIELAGLRPEQTFLTNGAGVNSSVFFPPASPRANGPLRVLFASRLLRAKGVDTFIEAAKLTDPQRIQFLIAGISADDDPDEFPVDRLIDNPHVRFLGEVRDMAALLREVDVVCLPTRYGEGIPRILIEAAASGRPSIASDIDGCRQIVLDGETGSIVDCSDDMAAAHRISELLLQYAADPDLLRRHGENALQWFNRGQFDEQFVTRKIVNLLLGHTDGASATDR
jgi:glycosyltransferase involved in cell wall biosynthesis